jgi:N6-L-threonylcarbamoyladenine synthase
MNILGIETSCDETAAAVVADGTTILSSVVASQVDVHHRFGGVVPELAARRHIEAVAPVVDEAIRKAEITPREIDAVAVTQGPGLVGALLVGFCFARALAYDLHIPWVGVDHLEGHIQSLFLQTPSPPFPFVVLLASGGHTNIYHVTSHTQSRCMGQTLDDAAGEAFDKVAKILGLGYPGGALISKLAEAGDPARIRFPRSYLDREAFNFSFSGIKTAVNRYIQTHPEALPDEIVHIAAGFQEAVMDVLTEKIILAAEKTGCGHIAIVGGVSANPRLRQRLRKAADALNKNVYMPPPELCGDNAAMIAAAGYRRLCASEHETEIGALDADVYSRSPLRDVS